MKNVLFLVALLGCWPAPCLAQVAGWMVKNETAELEAAELVSEATAYRTAQGVAEQAYAALVRGETIPAVRMVDGWKGGEEIATEVYVEGLLAGLGLAEGITAATPLILTGSEVSIPAATGTSSGYLTWEHWIAFWKAYEERATWDGGATGLDVSAARSSLELATTFLALAGGTLTGSLTVQGDITTTGNILMSNTQFLALDGNITSSGEWSRAADGYNIQHGGTGVQLRAGGNTYVTVAAANTTLANQLSLPSAITAQIASASGFVTTSGDYSFSTITGQGIRWYNPSGHNPTRLYQSGLDLILDYRNTLQLNRSTISQWIFGENELYPTTSGTRNLGRAANRIGTAYTLNLDVSGNTTLGDAAGDTITFTGEARGHPVPIGPFVGNGGGGYTTYAGTTSSSTWGYVANGAGSVVGISGQGYGGPSQASVYKNGSALWSGALGFTGGENRAAVAAKGTYTFVAGDVLTVYSNGAGTPEHFTILITINTIAAYTPD